MKIISWVVGTLIRFVIFTTIAVPFMVIVLISMLYFFSWLANLLI